MLDMHKVTGSSPVPPTFGLRLVKSGQPQSAIVLGSALQAEAHLGNTIGYAESAVWSLRSRGSFAEKQGLAPGSTKAAIRETAELAAIQNVDRDEYPRCRPQGGGVAD